MSELKGTYRGCEIYFVQAAEDMGKPAYYTHCLSGKWYWTVQATKNAIDDKLGPEPPPPPPPPPPPEPEPEPKREWVEKYRDVDVWLILPDEYYWAQVEVGYVAIAWTLTEVRRNIDDILELLYPDEEPPEGLFAQVTTAVKAWVLANLPDWVLEWGKVINNWITNTYETIQNVYNNFVEYVTNVYNNTYETISNVFNTFKEYVTNVYNYVTENITNIYNNTYEYFTNVVGVSQEILDNTRASIISFINDRLLNYAPQGFQSDPEKFIQDHAEERYHSMLEEAIRSFWEGFEEGLKE